MLLLPATLEPTFEHGTPTEAPTRCSVERLLHGVALGL